MPPNYYMISALLIAGSIAVMLALFTIQRRGGAGALAFIGLLLAASVYAISYAFELTSTTLPRMLFWTKIQYFGIATIPALWIILAIQFAGKDRWLTRPVLIALFSIPAATLILHFTDSYHHLYYHAATVSMQPFPHLIIIKGPWYWVQVAYTYLSLVYGNILLLSNFWQAAPPYKKQAAIILVGSLAPLVCNTIYQLEESPYGLDLSPFAFILTCLLYTWGLFQNRLFDLAPIAHDKVFAGIRDGVLVLDMQNRIVDFNTSFQGIGGSLMPNAIGHDAKEVLIGYLELLTQLSSNQEQSELKIIEANQTRYYSSHLSPVMNNKNEAIGKTLIITETTQQVLLLEQLQRLATIDDLTGVFNRRHFLDISSREIDLTRRYQHPVSAIMIDLDRFKQINDTLGHKAGDLALQTTADICLQTLRASDLFCRYGGDEFAALLPETAPEVAVQVAERLRGNIAAARMSFGATEIRTTASFGVAGGRSTTNMELDDLLKNADRALYQAKAAGRNQVVLA